MKKLKISLIGTGHAGVDFHLPGLSTFKDIDLSICDINEKLLHAAGNRFGIPAGKRYSDYREMYRRENPSAVMIMMAQYPTVVENDRCQVVASTRSRDAYFKIVGDALRQKKHVMVEKPLAMTPREALPLVRAAEKAGTVTMVSENRRFNPLVQYCLEKVLARGPVLNTSCHFYKCEPQRHKVRMKNGREKWLEDSKTDWLTGDMIHALYLMRHIGGGEIIDFSPSMGAIAGDKVPTAFHALARFASGATGLFSSNVRAGARRELWEIHGAGISAYIEGVPYGTNAYGAETMPKDMDARAMRACIYADNKFARPEVVYDFQAAGTNNYQVCAGFTGADRHFLDCVRQNKQPRCNFADAYKTLLCCEKILEGRFMKIK